MMLFMYSLWDRPMCKVGFGPFWNTWLISARSLWKVNYFFPVSQTSDPEISLKFLSILLTYTQKHKHENTNRINQTDSKHFISLLQVTVLMDLLITVMLLDPRTFMQLVVLLQPVVYYSKVICDVGGTVSRCGEFNNASSKCFHMFTLCITCHQSISLIETLRPESRIANDMQLK